MRIRSNPEPVNLDPDPVLCYAGYLDDQKDGSKEDPDPVNIHPGPQPCYLGSLDEPRMVVYSLEDPNPVFLRVEYGQSPHEFSILFRIP